MAKGNEVVGPKLWMWRKKRTEPWHITGGYSQPDHKTTLCGRRKIDATDVVYDPRDIVPYKGMTDMNNYCKNCLNMMVYESMSEQVLFSQIKVPGGGTFGATLLANYLKRKSPPIELNNPPPLKDAKSAKAGEVAGSPPPKKYKLMTQSQLEKKQREKSSRKTKTPRSKKPKKPKSQASKKPKIDKGDATQSTPEVIKVDKTKSAAQIIGPKRVLGNSSTDSNDQS